MEGETCFTIYKGEWVEAKYLGLFQFSKVIEPSPMIGGHPGGVIAYPVAVVKLYDKLVKVDLAKVKFSKEELN